MRSRILAFALLLWAGFARAETVAPSGSARSHFEAGLAAVGRGEIDTGLHEFEAAYAIQPRYSVLFNIGQAYAALGRPVEAIAAFERFLALGGDQISAARREEVERLIARNRQLTGQLRLKVQTPERTRLWLDGQAVSAADVERLIAIRVGEHSLVHSYGHGYPVEQKVQIRSEQVAEVTIAAEPASAEAGLARVSVGCDVPGVTVDVGGRVVGTTPLADAVSAPPGELVLVFRRAGYETRRRTLQVSQNERVHVDCDVRLELSPPPHVRPAPTRAELERQQAATNRKRAWSYVLAGTGVAFIGGGVATYAWNQGRYDDWQAARSAEQPLVDRAVSIQRADDAALGMAIVGAGLTAFGTWMWATATSHD